jgi:hypothetical protein
MFAPVPVSLLLLAATPQLALISTPANGGYSELRFQPIDAREQVKPVLRFSHVSEESVLGAVVPGKRAVVVNAVLLPHKDLSFAGNLLWLEEGKPVRALCDRVALANRPHVSSDGRIFVQRGVAGTALERVDQVSVDEVRSNGTTKTLIHFEGHAAFIAGQWGSELLVYRVLPQGKADLVAVHVDNLRVRTLTLVTPLARREGQGAVADERARLAPRARRPRDRSAAAGRRGERDDGAAPDGVPERARGDQRGRGQRPALARGRARRSTAGQRLSAPARVRR